jgi:uncharacterized protein (UPF0264 family)
MQLKLLVSPSDEKEASEAVLGGADIIDVKNPKEGALGASFPWVIQKIRLAIPPHIEVSCTLGDLPNLPGTAALAALGASTLKINYIKAGLLRLVSKDKAVYLMRNIVKAIKDRDSTIKVVAAGYADAERIGSVNPKLIPSICNEAKCDLAMLDTAIKDGKSLLEFITIDQLGSFVDEAHDYGLRVALAGCLKKEDLHSLFALGADIVGFRSALCTGRDRIHGRIKQNNVLEIVRTIRNLELRYNET